MGTCDLKRKIQLGERRPRWQTADRPWIPELSESLRKLQIPGSKDRVTWLFLPTMILPILKMHVIYNDERLN
jgi:hypothetical protein